MATKGGSTAVGKTLAVIDALGERRRLGEIAEASGLPKSTVHRILQALIEHDFARAGGDGTYSAGPRILSIAGQVLGGRDHVARADPALRSLQAASGYTVHFAMFAGDEAVYVQKLEAPTQPYRMASRVGMRLRLHCTGIGKSILAHLPPDDVTRLVGDEPFERRTPRTIASRKELDAELERIRAVHFAIDDEENEAGIRCVAAPVFDHRGHIAGGVSVSALALELDRAAAEALGSRVVVGAREVSLSLGAPETLQELAVPAA